MDQNQGNIVETTYSFIEVVVAHNGNSNTQTKERC